MVLLEVVVDVLLPTGSQLQCCIVNVPVLEMKSEKMSAYSILVQERTSELHSPLLSGEKGLSLWEIPGISSFC